MKIKSSKFLIPVFMFLMFIFMWSGSSFKVSAGSTDLYFPNSAIAGGYDDNGDVIIKKTIDVYLHNNKGGYNLNSNLRVSSIKVSVGDKAVLHSLTDKYQDSQGNELAYFSSTSNQTFPTEGYGSKQSSENSQETYLQKITINISQYMDEIYKVLETNKLSKYTNEVVLTIDFERKGSLFEGYGWKNFDLTVNSYNRGEKENSFNGYGKATLFVSDNTLASSTYLIDRFSLLNTANPSLETIQQTDIIKAYNLKDYNDKTPIYLHVRFSSAISGNLVIYFNYKNEKISKTITFDDSFNENYKVINVDEMLRYEGNKVENIYAQCDVEIKVDSEASDLKDRYGSAIKLESSTSFHLDNVAPEITSSYFNNSTSDVIHDLGEIYPYFALSENEVTYSDFNCQYLVGENLENGKIVECDLLDDDRNGSTGSDYFIQKTLLVSANGKVRLHTFTITIVDKYGNTTEYNLERAKKVNSNGAEVSQPVITFKSSVVAAEVKDNNTLDKTKKYYYQGESFIIEVELNGELDLETTFKNEFDKTYLVYKNSNEKYIFNSYTTETITDGGVTRKFVRYIYNVTDETEDVITKIVFSRKKETAPGFYSSKIVAEEHINISLNDYIDLEEKDVIKTSSGNVKLYENSEIKSLASNGEKFIYDNTGGLKEFTCSLIETTSIDCSYITDADGVYNISVERAIIKLNNGKINNDTVFVLKINTQAPTIVWDVTNAFEYGNAIYYKSDAYLDLTLSDGYGEKSCLYYNFDSDKNLNEFCLNGNVSEWTIDLVSTPGEHTFYYYTSDGEYFTQTKAYEKKFIYRGEFVVSDINLTINDQSINENTTSLNGIFNYVDLSYSNAKKADLLKKIDVNIPDKGINKTCEILNGVCKFDTGTISISKGDLPLIDDITNVEVVLTDLLGNVKVYVVQIDLDTVDPIFDNVVVSVAINGTGYDVTISDYQPYSIEVKVDGVVVTLNGNSFYTSKEKFTLYLQDEALNVGSKVFTTVSPYIELFELSSTQNNVTYEINISPFDNTIHVIEEYKYLIFDYNALVNQEEIDIAKANVCTTGRKVNCYMDGNYSSNLINQTFNRGFTYIILVKVNNVLVNLKNSNALPRLDLVGSDVISPIGGFLDDDINPDYISSTSNKEFKFSFLASDINLVNKYYYLVAKASLNMDIDKFYDLYTNCYGATASSNSCGIKGVNEYSDEVETNTYLGEVVITANNNTRKRLDNNTMYSLYVLILDKANNETLFKVRNFTNITHSSNVEYKNDSGVFVEANNEVSTENTTELKISKYGEIDLEKVSVNGVNISCSASGCNYVLVAGKHVVEVVDVLGNVKTTTVYSAISSKPVIELQYLYGGVYYKLTDSIYSYNTDNTNNIYIKVSGNNLANVIVVTDGLNKTYVAGNDLFDEITSSSNLYGITLYQLMTLHSGNVNYDGIITLSATNSDGSYSSISMQVDNTKPEITLALPETNINLLGEQYKLTYSAGKYSLTFNYKSDITYAYLLEALLVKVDGDNILSILDVDRLKIRCDGAVIEDLYASIIKGNKLITIDYFDSAGNVATQVVINISVVDTEKPVIVLRNTNDTIELNVPSLLAEVIAVDNHDQVLTIVATVGGQIINYKNYTFMSVGEHVITYSVKDSSNNEATLTQTVLVKDTIPPTLKEGTIKQYSTGVENVLEFDMPIFVDSDGTLSEYYPHQIKMLDTLGNELNPILATYPLSYTLDTVSIRFPKGYELGVYTVVFVAKDVENNAVIEEFEIELKDLTSPIIDIFINGNKVDNESVNTFPFNSDILIQATASDVYDGNLSSSIKKEIFYGGNKVNSIDTSKSGEYLIKFSVSDSNENSSVTTTTIRIAKDNLLPIIDKVTFNGLEASENKVNKLSGNSLIIEVEASDDSNQVVVSIVFDDEVNSYNIANGSSLSLENGLNGYSFNIKVEVVDSSNNKVEKIYTFIVDNVAPSIIGVKDNAMYLSKVDLQIYDDNIELIEVYKNSNKVTSLNANTNNYRIAEAGLYKIVAKDSYGNERTVQFIIYDNNKYMIRDDSGNVSEKEFDKAILLETKVDGGKIEFVIDDSYRFEQNDQIYILVNYPESTEKYIIYSMNGQTYNTNTTLTIDEQIIIGVDNSTLLEKIGDKYYVYAMVVENGVENDEEITNESNSAFSKILLIILAVLGGIGLVVIIIKIRGRVRAV